MAKTTKTAAAPKKVQAKKAAPKALASAPAVRKTTRSKAAAPVAASAEKEDSYVSKLQAAKAISELAKYLERTAEAKKSEKDDLFADEDDDESKDLFVEFQTKKYYSERPDFKPKLISLTKPFNNDDRKTCLFLRDNFIASEEQLEKVEEAKIPTLEKILTLTQLKTIYKQYEKRRELYGQYDVFVVDDALLSSMPAVLGLTFYNADKSKVPVNIRVASTKVRNELSLVTLQNQIAKVLGSTVFLPPVGNTVVVKIGAINKHYTQEELVANLQDVLKQFTEDALVTVGVKTTSSPVLPLFYTSKIYEDSDVLETAPKEEKLEDEEDAFTNGLLELADAETVTKVLGTALRTKKAKKPTNGVSKP